MLDATFVTLSDWCVEAVLSSTWWKEKEKKVCCGPDRRNRNRNVRRCWCRLRESLASVARLSLGAAVRGVMRLDGHLVSLFRHTRGVPSNRRVLCGLCPNYVSNLNLSSASMEIAPLFLPR